MLPNLTVGHSVDLMSLRTVDIDSDKASATVRSYVPAGGLGAASRSRGSYSEQGDPARAAEGIIAAVEAPDPPLASAAQKAALDLARKKLEALRKDFDACERRRWMPGSYLAVRRSRPDTAGEQS